MIKRVMAALLLLVSAAGAQTMDDYYQMMCGTVIADSAEAPDTGFLYVTAGTYIYKYSRQDGQIVSSLNTGRNVLRPATYSTYVYVGANNDYAIRKHNLTDLVYQAPASADFGNYIGGPVVYGAEIFTCANKNVIKLNATTLATIKQTSMGASLYGCAVSDTYIYYGKISSLNATLKSTMPSSGNLTTALNSPGYSIYCNGSYVYVIQDTVIRRYATDLTGLTTSQACPESGNLGTGMVLVFDGAYIYGAVGVGNNVKIVKWNLSDLTVATTGPAIYSPGNPPSAGFPVYLVRSGNYLYLGGYNWLKSTRKISMSTLASVLTFSATPVEHTGVLAYP